MERRGKGGEIDEKTGIARPEGKGLKGSGRVICGNERERRWKRQREGKERLERGMERQES